MVMEELLGLVKGQAEDFSDLTGGQLTRGVALEQKNFEQGAGLRCLIQGEVLGDLIGNFDGNDHPCIVSESDCEARASRNCQC
jgi:hypothetical protein